MSRPNGGVDAQFDAAGFEVPFAESYEDESPSDSEAAFGAEAGTPFAESTLERDAAEEADLWPEAQGREAQRGENDETLAWLDMEALGGEAVDERSGSAEYASEPEFEADSLLALSERLDPGSGIDSLASEATTESWSER